MKYLNSKEISKAVNRNYIYLGLAILFLVITIILIYIGYKEQKIDYVSMNSLTGDLNELKNKNVYVDVAMPPYLFATYKDNETKKFYLAMDNDNFLYVVYMDNNTYNELSKINKKSIRIVGVTEEITSDIKELAIESYNKELGEEYLTKENFEEFVGPVFLNTTIILDNSILYYIGSIFTFCTFIILITYFLTLYLKTRNVLKKYSKEELEKIGMQIYSLSLNPYRELKLYLTKEYLIDYSHGLTILKYEDILWAYPYEYKYNGLLVNKNIKIYNNNQKFEVANTKYIKKDKEKTLEEILNKLKQKNKNIIIGYNKDTKKEIKKFRKTKKTTL